MATAAPPKNGYLIGVTCPGCGADLELQSDFFVLQCEHCGSVLRIVMPDTPPAFCIPAKKNEPEIRFLVDRHLKELQTPLTGAGYSLRRIYYPYWRVEAILLREKNREIRSERSETAAYADGFDGGDWFSFGQSLTNSAAQGASSERVSEVSLTPYLVTVAAGQPLAGIPETLGFRTEYVKMTPYAAESIDDASVRLPMVKTWDDAQTDMKRLAGMAAAVGAGRDEWIARQQLFHPTGSIVYFPYFLVQTGGRENRTLVVDGLSGRVVHATETGQLDDTMAAVNDAPLDASFGHLTVEFHRCHNCGVDLPSTKSSVYICHNCDRVVSLERASRIDAGILAVPDTANMTDQYFPFWRFQLPPAQIASVVSLPTTSATLEWLVVPGFKTANYAVMRRLIQGMTAALPNLSGRVAEYYDRRFLPVTFSLSEAMTLAEIILFHDRPGRKPVAADPSPGVQPLQVGLLYAPFRPEIYCYVDSVLNAVTFVKSAVSPQYTSAAGVDK
jgi:predicted RNA-binding Zn-ribbon protein involved in translation (DUF1610 family)